MKNQKLSERPISFESTSTGCPLCGKNRFVTVMNYSGKSPLFQKKKVVRCLGCSFLYMDPLLGHTALTNYYQTGTYWGHVTHKTPFDIPTYHYQANSRISFIQTYSPLRAKMRILDIGAGYGVLEEAFRARFNMLELYAVEPDPKAQHQLKQLGVQVEKELHYFSGQRFDLIIASHLLEHLISPINFLKELRSYMAPGGALFIEVPNQDHRFKFQLEPHISFFSPESLRNAVEQAGWSVQHNDTCGPRWQDERQKQRRNTWRQNLMKWVPWKEQLKSIKQHWTQKQSSSAVNLLPPDTYQCDTYGGDRIWIRLLAQPKTS